MAPKIQVPVSEELYGAEYQTGTREGAWVIFSDYYPKVCISFEMFFFRNRNEMKSKFSILFLLYATLLAFHFTHFFIIH